MNGEKLSPLKVVQKDPQLLANIPPLFTFYTDQGRLIVFHLLIAQ